MTLKIRRMTLDDVSDVVALEKICFSSDAWCADDFIYRLNFASKAGGDGFLSLCAEADGRFCGYIALYSQLGETNIDSLAVSPEMRSRGVARALLHEAERLCRPERIILEVRESNTPAKCLYESEGYRVIAKRRGYYDLPPEDALIMEKLIKY